MEFNEYASRAEAVIDPAQEQDRQQVPLADPSGTRKRTRNFRPQSSEVDAQRASHRSNMTNNLQFNGRSRPHQDLDADATSSPGAIEWRTASKAEHLMTRLSEFLCDLYFRTLEYLYFYLYNAYRAVTRMSPSAAMVLKRLAPMFLSLFLLYVFITVLVNVALAVNAGITQYAKAIICNAPIYLPVSSYLCSNYNTQAPFDSTSSNSTFPDFSDSYSSYSELAERNYESRSHTIHLSQIDRQVRSLGLEVGSSSLDAATKERLSGKFAGYREMIDQTRETTEELQIKIELTIDAVLAQTNYSSNDLDRLQQKSDLFKEKHRSTGLSITFLRFAAWLTDHNLVRIPPGVVPVSVVPRYLEPESEAASNFQTDLLRISEYLGNSIATAEETSRDYRKLGMLTEQLIDELTKQEMLVVDEQTSIVENRGLITLLGAIVGKRMTDTDSSSEKMYLLQKMLNEFRVMAKFYEDTKPFLKRILISYKDADAYLDQQKKNLRKALAGQGVPADEPVSLIRDLRAVVTQMESKAARLQKTMVEWTEEGRRFRDHIFERSRDQRQAPSSAQDPRISWID